MNLTGYETVEVVVKGLQGCGPSSPAVDRKCEPSLCYTSCLGVQLHSRRVLEAGKMAPLGVPDDGHPLLVHYGDAHGFPGFLEGLQHLSNQQFCLLHASRAAATVLGQLFGAELAGKQLICKACDALPLLQLPPFCLPQKGHISLIPHENAGRELCHEQAVERVTVSVQTCSEAPQEVPHIQTNHQIIPAAEHGSCPGRAHSRAAVSVHIEECGGCHSSRLVPVHQACGHGQQPLTLMWGEHGHEDLPVLIPHIGDPGCGASGCSCQFFDHLLLKNRRFNKLQTCLTSTKDQMCKYSCI